MEKPLVFPATISKVETMSDKSIRLRIDTQEMVGEDKAKIMNMADQLGYCAFAPQPFDEIDTVDAPKLEKEEGRKSLSERLYAVMFVYWSECTNKATPFNAWREMAIKKLIQQWKDKLPPRNE